MILESRNGTYELHPEGIYPAVCVDVIDLGLQRREFQGETKMVPRLRVVFETEAVGSDGRRLSVSKSFTASLHQKAKLAEFLGKWRGRPVMPGESVDLDKLIGACCTLVVSHATLRNGEKYASIDGVSKPTRKVAPSGTYDPAAVRQRMAERLAREGAPVRAAAVSPTPAAAPTRAAAAVPAVAAAPGGCPAGGYDPEVGF
jgi:hypothetical protein